MKQNTLTDAEKFNQTIAARLAYAMRQNGVNQKYLVKKMKCTQPTLSRYLNFPLEMRLDKLWLLCHYIGTPIDMVIAGYAVKYGEKVVYGI